MDDTQPPPADDTSLAGEIRALIADARRMVAAEIAYQSARAGMAGKLVAQMAAFCALALALLFFALMALVVGLLLALAPLLGPWGALAAVVGGLMVATAIAVMAVLMGWRRLRRLIADGKDSAS